jgi:hypothetical protein
MVVVWILNFFLLLMVVGILAAMQKQARDYQEEVREFQSKYYKRKRTPVNHVAVIDSEAHLVTKAVSDDGQN